MVKAKLPWPPSVNHYWVHTKSGRVFIGPRGLAFREAVKLAVRGQPPLGANHVFMTIEALPPDNRRRDLDNILKCLLDSFEHAGVYNDDSQVKHIDAQMLPPEKGTEGFVWVVLEVA
jgi:crossover junction endodeoxyribonuclease RusA